MEKDFHHPYQPYAIQVEFMKTLYDCLEKGQVGIFESPTGTGKSLSIICGSLTWLREQQRTLIEGEAENADDDEPDWVIQHTRAERVKEAIVRRQELEERLSKIRAHETRQKVAYERGEPPAKRTKTSQSAPSEADNEAQFMLDDYDSGDDKDRKEPHASGGLSDRTTKLLKELGMLPDTDPKDEEVEAVVKIFYCSRTHSQLGQFANEVRRVKIPSALRSLGKGNGDEAEIEESIKLLSLSSRKNTCIHPKVSKLSSATAINERCIELQQQNTLQEHKCGFLPNKENEALVNEFRDHVLARVRDIEDLRDLGKKVGICPYYASRAVVNPSEIVTLPYPLLLQKSAREALGLSVKDHVVIIDEAHNLINAIEGIHSVSVSLEVLQRARRQLGIYLQKFHNKLKGSNRVYATQVVRLVDSLSGCLQVKAALVKARGDGGVVEIADLVSGKGADQINLHKLIRYLQESKLARKVNGYIEATEKVKALLSPPEETTTTPALMIVEGFFRTLTNPKSEGRFFFAKDDSGSLCLKYMLLDAAYHFQDIIEDARAVILAGGTMSPMEDYIHHLVPYLQKDRIRTLSCGHVIPPSNLLALPITKHSDIVLDFTFDKRSSPDVVRECGSTLIELSRVVPDGLVVFFASFAYLEYVVEQWKGIMLNPRSNTVTVWNALSTLKPIYRESKGIIPVEAVLRDYAAAIDAGKGSGAVLLAVIGGKLSEGINFSDRLGRGVVVVGMPYPNSQSVQWKTKLEYIEESTVKRGGSRAEGKAAAREFSENACMRAVNQSVGRAIRHRADFAVIVLMDRRYKTDRVQQKLPGWIKGGLVKGTDGREFTDVMGDIGTFFKQKGIESV